MNCPRCRGMVAQGSLFCPNCGNDLRQFIPPQQTSMPPVGMQAQPNQPSSTLSVKEQMKQARKMGPVGYYQGANGAPQKQSRLGWIVGGVSLLALIILGFFVMNLLQKQGNQGPDMLVSKGKEGAILEQTGKTAPILEQTGKEAPVLEDTARAPAKMPPDVLRWLEHLARIEKLRGQRAQEGLSSLMVLAQSAQFGTDMQGLQDLASGDPDAEMPASAADRVAGHGTKTRASWSELKRDFDSLPPPAECQTIADSYTHALDETGSMISDVMDAIELSKSDTQKALSALYGMKNQSSQIDKYGDETDGKVKAICDKYDTRKWFSISSDFGNSSILGSLGAR